MLEKTLLKKFVCGTVYIIMQKLLLFHHHSAAYSAKAKATDLLLNFA